MYLETLFDLLDKHVAVCSKTIDGQDCTIGPVAMRRVRIAVCGGGSGTYSLKTFGAYLV